MIRPCALLLCKPCARQGDSDMDGGVALLRERGIEVIEASCKDVAEVAALCRAHAGGIDRVIAAGGDGTVSMIVNGIAGLDLSLGVVPLGTANDFARTLGIPDSIAEAFAVIARGQTRTVDLGQVNQHYFLNVAHIGFGVEVARRLPSRLKRWLGPLSYMVAALDTLRVLRPIGVHIRAGRHERHLRVVQLAIGNGVYYGGGTPVAHDARIDDARLDLYAVPPQPWWRWFRVAVALRRGRTQDLRDVLSLRASEIEVRTRRPHGITADGEPAARTPAVFRCHPAALRIYVPGDTGVSLH